MYWGEHKHAFAEVGGALDTKREYWLKISSIVFLLLLLGVFFALADQP